MEAKTRSKLKDDRCCRDPEPRITVTERSAVDAVTTGRVPSAVSRSFIGRRRTTTRIEAPVEAEAEAPVEAEANADAVVVDIFNLVSLGCFVSVKKFHFSKLLFPNCYHYNKAKITFQTSNNNN